MNLLIDWGNSRIKWAADEGDTLEVRAFSAPDAESLFEQEWGALPGPACILVSCVAGEGAQRRLNQWCESHWGIAPEYVTSKKEQLGIRNAYSNASTLGNDRWAALIAAWNLYGASCVIDCGTAVTLDAVNKSGQCFGGPIFPGEQLLFGALVSRTEGIRVSKGNAERLVVDNTADGVTAGVLAGWKAAITSLAQQYRQQLGFDTRLILTGGGASSVLTELASDKDCIVAPDLVLEGLRMLANEKR